MKKYLTFLVSTFAFGALTASAQTSTYSNFGGITVVTGPNGSYVSGPNGTFVVNSNSDQIGGTWKGGINVDINQVMTGASLPQKMVVNDFDLKMNDDSEILLLAQSAEEVKKGDTQSRDKRAQVICAMTKVYPHVYSVETKTKWLKGLLLDIIDSKIENNAPVYSTYLVAERFKARYFSEIVCGSIPKNYQ